jgi:acyl dehydratase
MAIDYERLLKWKVRSVQQQYSASDVMLYALGLGLGLGQDDPHQLRFVYEDGLLVLPTMATVLGHPGFWMSDPATGVDWKQVLHGEQGLEIHRPLSVSGNVVGHTRVEAIVDKGPGRGALLYSTRQILDARSQELLCTLTATQFMRSEGGFGGPSGPVKKPPAMPAGRPQAVRDFETTLQTALIYRLSGDLNPLHADPAVARAAGFTKPILHGLASFGIAGYGIVREFCRGDPTRLKGLHVRFTSPVYPGETLRLEMWTSGSNGCAFRCKAVERDVTVLSHGVALYS